MVSPYPQPQPSWGEQPPPVPPTDVVGRRVAQYLVDVLLVGALASVLVLGALAVALAIDPDLQGEWITWLLILLAAVASVAFAVWYWVLWPAGHDGQTFGMRLLGIRVVDEGGGPASAGQLAIRWLLLIVDGQISGVVGLVVMLVSARNQRVGDMLARTLVVDAARYPAGSRLP